MPKADVAVRRCPELAPAGTDDEAVPTSRVGGVRLSGPVFANAPERTREVLGGVNVEMHFARVVGVGLSLFVVTALGGTAASSSPALPLLPPPSFQPAPNEWLTVTTGPTRHRFTANPPRAVGIAPQVWAITVRDSDLSALQPYSPGTGLLRLRPSAALITAITVERGGATRNYRPSGWPLRLGAFHVSRTWETQPAPNVQERVRDVAVSGWRLDVRVYFATQHPSTPLLRVTRAELSRMRLP
jgi:hypothetical protein